MTLTAQIAKVIAIDWGGGVNPMVTAEKVEQMANQWQPIETLPEGVEALVCVTHNVPADEGDTRPSAGDGYVWETVQWVDWYSKRDGWFSFPHLIHIPFTPTAWMPLPSPPPVSPPSD